MSILSPLNGRTTKDAINNKLNYKYNKKAQLQAIVDPIENQTNYSYDKYGRVEKEELPNQKEIEKVYNKDHTLKTIIREDTSEVMSCPNGQTDFLHKK